MVQQTTTADKVAYQQFCEDMLDQIGDDKTFLNYLIFSSETTYHISGKMMNTYTAESGDS